jgi:DNA-binding HxlR family transcriptional regulator
MSESFQLKNRGIQILKILKDNGPLSFRGLKTIISPEIKDRRLHGSLARLVVKGLVTKRQERVFRGAGVFYQLTQNDSLRERIAFLLGCSTVDLRQPFFRSRELMHTESCALWAHKLQALFPSAKLIRDFQFYRDDRVHEVMLTQKNEYELLPDLLMILDGTMGGPKVSVAFEIERSRKSKSRILTKLRKYADETVLDGVVYLCESEQISEPVALIYKTKISTKSLRISHYGDCFLLLTKQMEASEQEKIKMYTSNGSDVSLEAWIDNFLKIPLTLRRSKNFEVGAVSCSHFDKFA